MVFAAENSGDYVNPKFFVKECRDPRLGKGVYTREKVSKGEVVLVITDGRIRADEEWAALPKRYREYCFDVDDDSFFSPLDFENLSLGWFVNHSCAPNCGSGEGIAMFVAMRDIEPGEEITLDYAMFTSDPDPPWRMECWCDAENCRGVITANDWIIPELQERYCGYFQRNIQAKIDALRGHARHRRGASST